MSRKNAVSSLWLVATLAAPFALVAGGCAKVNTMGAGSDTGGATGSGGIRGTGETGGSTVSGSGGFTRADGGFVTAETGGMTCQEGMYKHVPQIPTVFLLVDQSGSMFKCRTTGGQMDSTGRECANHADTSWYPLRDGVLTVIKQLQADVRFGFAAFTGEQGDAMCPVLKPVLPAQDNQAAIATNYNALLPPKKGETPTRKALEQVATILKADTAPGEKFILFVTDGEPDYCDDGNSLCPPDSVVGGLQTLYSTAKIKTLVMGINSPLTTISGTVLQGFANAGAGQPVVPPLQSGQDLNAFYDQCNGVAGWKADFTTTGKPAMRAATAAGPFPTIGDYVTTGGGTATVYKPDVTNQTALINEISRALSGVKSCTFDLNNLDGKMLKVDMTMLAAVTVKVMDTVVPLDMTNGWRMNNASELELVGDACTNWRMPQNTNIDIKIPCQAIIIE